MNPPLINDYMEKVLNTFFKEKVSIMRSAERFDVKNMVVILLHHESKELQ